MAGLIDVVSTSLSIKAIKLAGCKLPGHTKSIRLRPKSDYGLTMFHVHNLRVFFVSKASYGAESRL